MTIDHMLRNAIDAAPDAVLISDTKGIIRYWNRGAEQIFGYSSQEAVGQSLDLFIPERLRDRHWEGYHRVMTTGETKYQSGLLNSPGIHKCGSQLSLEFSMIPLHDDHDEILGCAAIMRDVTARWMKEKELQKRIEAYQNAH